VTLVGWWYGFNVEMSNFNYIIQIKIIKLFERNYKLGLKVYKIQKKSNLKIISSKCRKVFNPTKFAKNK
jgi:hypothetical protein